MDFVNEIKRAHCGKTLSVMRKEDVKSGKADPLVALVNPVGLLRQRSPLHAPSEVEH